MCRSLQRSIAGKYVYQARGRIHKAIAAGRLGVAGEITDIVAGTGMTVAGLGVAAASRVAMDAVFKIAMIFLNKEPMKFGVLEIIEHGAETGT